VEVVIEGWVRSYKVDIRFPRSVPKDGQQFLLVGMGMSSLEEVKWHVYHASERTAANVTASSSQGGEKRTVGV